MTRRCGGVIWNLWHPAATRNRMRLQFQRRNSIDNFIDELAKADFEKERGRGREGTLGKLFYWLNRYSKCWSRNVFAITLVIYSIVMKGTSTPRRMCFAAPRLNFETGFLSNTGEVHRSFLHLLKIAIRRIHESNVLAISAEKFRSRC